MQTLKRHSSFVIALISAASLAASSATGREAKSLLIIRDFMDSRIENPFHVKSMAAADSDRSGWHFVRTPHPRGGADAISITHTPDTLRSDPDLAGFMFRCGEREIEALIILLRTFPLRATVQVTLGEKTKEKEFDATIAPPGAAILLPPEVIVLANGIWQTLPDLSIRIEHEKSVISGSVPLAGMSAALAELNANCDQR